MITQEQFLEIVAEARLAPSAHNTQPVRWSYGGDAITLSVDCNRRLPYADPKDRDLRIAGGAAVEGTVLALAAAGIGAEVAWLPPDEEGRFRPFAKVKPAGEPCQADIVLAACVHRRITHRGGFLPVPKPRLEAWKNPNLTMATNKDDIAWLAEKVDQASANLLSDVALRTELLAWMRLDPTAAHYQYDGLNRETLFMGRFTARLARLVLGSGLYDILSKMGLGPALSGEGPRTKTASAIALFHWPNSLSLFDAGRAFYRCWLEATDLGLVGWPAAALADESTISSQITTRFGVPPQNSLLNTIRLGAADGATPHRTRLSVADVII